jgi:fructosamine-3-kinase
MSDSHLLPSATLPWTPAEASALLRAWQGRETTCHTVTRLTGGVASSVFRLEFDRPPHVAVVKLHLREDGDPLPRERRWLEYLRRQTRVPCPEVYLQDDSGTTVTHSFLLLECLPGVNLVEARLAPEQRVMVEEELAAALLDLHSHTCDTFGGLEDGRGVSDWREIFLPSLLWARNQVARKLPGEVLRELDRALPFAEEALRDQSRPSLTHGDVWAANLMVAERGDGWHLTGVLDPLSLAYTEVEKELAYLEGFHTVGEAFFRAYTAQRPLRPGYEFRRLFYWLQADMVELWMNNPAADWPARILATSREVVARAAP